MSIWKPVNPIMGLRAFLVMGCVVLVGCDKVSRAVGRSGAPTTETRTGIYRIDAAAWPGVDKLLTKDGRVTFSGEKEKSGLYMLFVAESDIPRAKALLAVDSKTHGYVLKSAVTYLPDLESNSKK